MIIVAPSAFVVVSLISFISSPHSKGSFGSIRIGHDRVKTMRTKMAKSCSDDDAVKVITKMTKSCSSSSIVNKSHPPNTTDANNDIDAHSTYVHPFLDPESIEDRFHIIPDLFQNLTPPRHTEGIPILSSNSQQRTKGRRTYAAIVSYRGPKFPGGYEPVTEFPDLLTVKDCLTWKLEDALALEMEKKAMPTERSMVKGVDDNIKHSERLIDRSEKSDDAKSFDTDSSLIGSSNNSRREMSRKVEKGEKSRKGLSVATAGRTDANVSARGGLFSFSLRHDVTLDDTSFFKRVKMMSNGDVNGNNGVDEKHINGDRDDSAMTVRWIERVHPSFHATFSTVAREYIYILPLLLFDEKGYDDKYHDGLQSARTGDRQRNHITKLARIINVMLSAVEGQPIDYRALSYGKQRTTSTVCTIHRARCWGYDHLGQCMNVPSVSWEEKDVENEEEGKGEEKIANYEAVIGFGECWGDANTIDAITDDTSSCNGVTYHHPACLVFRVKADRFLRRMMRKIINSVMQEASVVLDNNFVQDVEHDSPWRQNWKNRVETGYRGGNRPAPAEGLCLWRVDTDTSTKIMR